jgi:hypothetical protein
MTSNILGLNNIINKDKINSSIILKDKEIDMLSDISFNTMQYDNVQKNNNLYDKDIKDIANEIGIDLDNLNDDIGGNFDEKANNPFNDLCLNKDDDNISIKSYKTFKTATIPIFKKENVTEADNFKKFSLTNPPPSPASSSKSIPQNNKFNNFNKVISKINPKTHNDTHNNKSYINTFYEEEVKNKKAMLIEQIQLLKLLLEEDGENVDKIPDVSEYDDVKKLEHIHRILKIKKDRAQFSTMGEEILLFFVHLLENVFDGKTTYFGKYAPDLRGFHCNVQQRLRRNRFETSTIVSNIVENYQISPHAKLLLELVPSLFLYSFTKSQHTSKFSKKDLNDNLSSINNL